MTTAIWWPPTIAFASISFQIENSSRSGGPGISGKEQVVAAPTGRWIAKAEAIVGSRIQHLCVRALIAQLKGRSNNILMSPCEPGWSPNALLGTGGATILSTFSDGATFSDGSEFEQDGTYAYFPNAQNLRDTQVLIHCVPALTAGQYFSIDGTLMKLHVIESVVSQSGSDFTVNIDPPLRYTYLASQRLNFGRPQCEMRLAGDLVGEVVRRRDDWSVPALQLVEVL